MLSPTLNRYFKMRYVKKQLFKVGLPRSNLYLINYKAEDKAVDVSDSKSNPSVVI